MKGLILVLLIVFTNSSFAQSNFEALQNQYLDYRSRQKQDSALLMARKISSSARMELGDSSFWYGIGLRFQGNVHKTLKNKDSLLYFWNETMSVFSKYLPNDPNHADVVNALALFYYEGGDYAQAILLSERSIQLREAYSTEDHADYADFINNAAVIYMASRQWDKAEGAYRKSYDMYSRLYGKEHGSCINSLSNQAKLYERMGKDSLAELRYKEVVDIRRSMHGNEHVDLASALSNLGVFYFYRARYPQAFDQFSAATQMRKKLLGENNLVYASSLETMGAIHWKLGNYEEAERNYVNCATLRKSILGEKHPDYGMVINNLAVLMVDKGDFSKAEDYYLESLEIKRVSVGEQHVDYALVLNNLGNFYGKMARFEEAVEMVQTSAEIRRKQLGNTHALYGSSLNSLAVLQMKLTKYSEAEKSLEEAGRVFAISPGKKSPEYVWYLNNSGLLYSSIGARQKAEDAFVEALSLLEVIYGKNHPEYANTLNNLGKLYYEYEEFEQSEQCYLLAKEIRRQQLGELHPSYAESLVSLGNLYYDKGDLEKTELCHQQALDIRKKSYGGKHPEYAVGLNNLGIFYKKIGDILKAAIYTAEALTIYEEVYGKENALCASMHVNLGLLYQQIGQYDTSMLHLTTALKMKEALFGRLHPESIDIYLNLGLVSMNNKRFDQALAFYDTTLQVMDKENLYMPLKKANTLNNTALVHIELMNWELAKESAFQSCALVEKHLGKKHESYLWNESNLALAIYKSGDYQKAFTLYEHGLNERLRYVSENFEWLSDAQRESFWKQQLRFFNRLYCFAADAHIAIPEVSGLLYNEALVNKGKLLEAHIRKHSGSSVLDEEREVLRQLRITLSKSESDGNVDKNSLDKLREKADSLDKDLAQKWSAYGEQKQHLTIHWEDVKKALKSGETAVEMVRYYDEEAAHYTYASLVLSPEFDYPKFVPLCTEDALQQLNIKVQLSELYDLVWEPLEPFLRNTKTIFYAPTGLLDQVPFHALYKGNGEDEVLATNALGRRGVVEGVESLETSGNVSYLIDQFTLHQFTSTRNLLLDSLPKRKNTSESSIVLLGGIDYDVIGNEKSASEKRRRTKGRTSRSAQMGGRALSYLPGTLEEVQNIQKNLLSKNWKSTCLVGVKATESALTDISRDTNVRFWHIATHGFAFQQAKKGTNQTTGPLFRSHPNPMVRSGLVLAGGNWAWLGNDTLSRIGWKENGILTALEVSHFDLSHLDLVVLSACETGLGKVEGAEGTFGLKRGFKMAGVKEIIISLWAVPDKETMELMHEFYAALVTHVSVDEAFEMATKSMRKRYPTQPELWAGFVLVR